MKRKKRRELAGSSTPGVALIMIIIVTLIVNIDSGLPSVSHLLPHPPSK